MSQNWADALLFICVVAQFFCVTASTTSASRMMFAFSRDRAVPGTPLAARLEAPRAGVRRRSRSASSPALLMIPAIWNYLVGYAVGNRDRGDRSLHRVRAPGVPPLPAWATASSTAPGASASTTSGSTRSRLSWVAFISILFSLPLFKAGLPWDAELHRGR